MFRPAFGGLRTVARNPCRAASLTARGISHLPHRAARFEDRPGALAQGPLAAAALVLATIAIVAASTTIGPLTLQMLFHLAAMNVVGPVLAASLPTSTRLALRRPWLLWSGAALQMALLWAWHAPAVQHGTTGAELPHATSLLILAAAGTLFWACVIESARRGSWGGLAALLLTGKLACLLGVLLIFATRDLYGLPGVVLAFCTTGPSSLDDQQLAGLLMITACPLSYLTAGVWQAARMLLGLEDAAGPVRSNLQSHGPA
ncbi:cytochrome c oxidase assembly protein [Bosea sp. Root381]|uniref:cytochrome c oxidase assembly protein n=1 Tax=Bosea sp. Root381 TaxID=1736524 RepID=UPI00244E6C79|nr:cytochrome c oxidase assembly protein [Bosea sp. Root381]